MANDSSDLKGLEPPAAGGRRADEAVRVALQIGQIRSAQRLASEAPEGRDVVAVGPDGVRALAVQPQATSSASVVSGWIGVGVIVQSLVAASSAAPAARATIATLRRAGMPGWVRAHGS